jgi:hypothetical protein
MKHSLAWLAAAVVLGLPPEAGETVAAQLSAPPTAAPVVSALVSRDEGGEITVRAVRTDQPVTVDGTLDEEIYARVQPVSDFIQQEPVEGAPSTEKTEVWILFDNEKLYISGRCWDTHPERGVVSELRRDENTITQNDHLVVAFDTFHDSRNGFFFQTNPAGALRDQAIIGEAGNDNWNTVWDVKSAKFEGGWTTEMAIPFKSLRYAGSGSQEWGIQFRRLVKWKNEWTHLTRVPRSYGPGGINRLSIAATLVGLETPAQSMNLELKPYVVSSIVTDRTASVPYNNDVTTDVGLDFKYGLTRGLIADLTVNTDFAQVEEDVQQVNLTRFSLFFPEKRDFFLEGQGIFNFGGVFFNNVITTPGDVPVLFFSRRIGLSAGQVVPVAAGGRVTGKAGRFTIGALNIQTRDKPEAGALATNFTAARVKWDILRRSNIGLLATRRAPALGTGTNVALGADIALLLLQSITFNGFYATTSTPGVHDGNSSYRAKFDYLGDRYGLIAETLMVGERFNPEVGFVRRTDIQRNFGQVRFSPRPAHSRLIRKLSWTAGVDYLTNRAGTVVENRESTANFLLTFHNSDLFGVDYVRGYERLPGDFTIAPGVVVPGGGYGYDTFRVSYTLGQQRKISGRVSAATGEFYTGTKHEVSYLGRVAPTATFAIEPGITLNWVDLPYGTFNARLLNSRIIVTPTPRMIISSLVQFNASAHSLSSSIRLRWEYAGGSELFVVYSDGRDTATGGLPALVNRSFALKITRLLRF